MAVRPEASLKEVAGVLAGKRISGVPVVDGERRVLGIVSEADILEKEGGAERHSSRVLEWLSEPKAGVLGAKLAARTAGEAMSRPAVTIEADRPLPAAAELMLKREVNRLPVVDREGKLTGIITRADLVRAFLRSDADILHEIREDVLRTLWISPGKVEVEVKQGEVRLGGRVETRSEAELVAGFVRRVPGVVSVSSDLGWAEDDLERRRQIR